ncbi:GNAT family N-acetyltransferase [Marilutibacter maris]|uniref:GNAT family N-acetyltransferase n=1 Tax=Marilutibacter maris TaxID=1605891 RepID=UPI003CCE3F22
MGLDIVNGPVVETERLILRVPRIGDFERYAQMFAHESANHIGGPLLRGEAWRRFLQMPGAWLLQGFGMFSVVEKASGLWVGQGGPWQPDGWPGTEVGYAFHPDARGKGYATETCVAAIDWAFDNLGWSEVIHCIAPANSASQAVARRLGSTRRGPGTLPPPLDVHEVDIWSQTREQWRARRAGVAP